jgi:cytochrome c oxidase cbb3-type subunit 4
MHIYSILASAMTVVSFILFIGIVMWAYSRRRRDAFREAALAPFAVPEDTSHE